MHVIKSVVKPGISLLGAEKLQPVHWVDPTDWFSKGTHRKPFKDHRGSTIQGETERAIVE